MSSYREISFRCLVSWGVAISVAISNAPVHALAGAESQPSTIDSPDDLMICQKLFGDDVGTMMQPDKNDGAKALTCTREGKKDGPYSSFHPDKSIRSRGHMCDDEMCGTWTRYFHGGAVQSVGDWERGRPEGKWTLFHLNGKKRQEGYFKNGRRVCGWMSWDEEGRLREGEVDRCVQSFRLPVKIKNKESEQDPVVQTALENGSKIVTGKGGSLTLSFPDKSKMIVGENSVFEIQGSSEGTKNVSLEQGGVRGVISKVEIPPARPRFMVRTKAAVMGVRGTDFVVNADETAKAADFRILEGTVSVAQSDEGVVSGKQSQSLAQGQWLHSTEQSLEAPQQFDVSAYRKQIEQIYAEQDIQGPRLQFGVGGWFSGMTVQEKNTGYIAKLASQLGQSIGINFIYPIDPRFSLLLSGYLKGASVNAGAGGKAYEQRDHWLYSNKFGLQFEVSPTIFLHLVAGQQSDYYLIGDTTGLMSLVSRSSEVLSAGMSIRAADVLGFQISAWMTGDFYLSKTWDELALTGGKMVVGGITLRRPDSSVELLSLSPYFGFKELETDIEKSNETIFGLMMNLELRL